MNLLLIFAGFLLEFTAEAASASYHFPVPMTLANFPSADQKNLQCPQSAVWRIRHQRAISAKGSRGRCERELEPARGSAVSVQYSVIQYSVPAQSPTRADAAIDCHSLFTLNLLISRKSFRRSIDGHNLRSAERRGSISDVIKWVSFRNI